MADDTDNLRLCTICGFTIDTSYGAKKPTVDFSTRGRGPKKDGHGDLDKSTHLRAEIAGLSTQLSAALKRAEEAERERDRLYAGLSALIHCQSPLSRSEVREAAAELLEPGRAVWLGGDQSPLARAVASLCSELSAANATIATMREESAWRPIETAPKDGSTILVFRPRARRYPVVGTDYWSDRLGNCWARSPDDEQPTHWRPFPSPPAEPK